MSKKVSQALEFVTEQTCTLLLCSPTLSVSPFKFVGQPFLGFGVHFREMHSLLKQTFSMKQRKISPLCPRLHFALLWTCVFNFISKISGFMCRGKHGEEIKFTRPETFSTLQIASETQIFGQKPSKADFYQKLSIFHFSKNRRDFILPSFWWASLNWRFFYFLFSLNWSKNWQKWTFSFSSKTVL